MSRRDPLSVRLACRVYARAAWRFTGQEAAAVREMMGTFRDLCLRESGWGGAGRVAWRTVQELWDLARHRRRVPGGSGRRGGGATGTVLAQAWRSVRRRPGHAAVFVATMGAGIGISAAMTTVVGAVALRDLPYRGADRLAQIWTLDNSRGMDGPSVNAADFLAWREHTQVFETFEGFAWETPRVLTGLGEPRQVMVARVTTGLFRQIGVSPVLGRGFGGDEGLPGGPQVVVLGYGLWASLFGADPAVLGRAVRLSDVDYEVIGVMPPDFTFPYGAAEAWLPVSATPTGLEAAGSLTGLAHLRPGLTREVAEERLRSSLRAEAGDAEPARLPIIMDLAFMRTPERTREALVLMLGAVLFVLVIATANVLSLGVAAAGGRRRELAIVAALGAGRGRILGQLVGESAILCAASAGAGLALAWAILAGLVPLIPERLNIITGGRSMTLWPDGVALAAGASLLAAPLVGVLAAALARAGVVGSLVRAAAAPDRARRRAQHALVATQVALSLILLAGAGLLLGSVSRLLRVDPGVAADQLVLVRVRLPANRYPDAGARTTIVRTMADALRGVPGVRSVATTASPLPLTQARFNPSLEGEGGETSSIDGFLPFHEVTDGFFETLGIEIREGRGLTEADRGRDVAVVNDLLAERLWPGQTALGRRFRVENDEPWLTVVGIAEDVPWMSLRDPEGEGMEFYAPPRERAGTWWTFALRTSGDPTQLADAARQAIWSVDDQQPIDEIVTYRDALGADLDRERFYAALLTCFAVLATLLAAVGIHAVVSQVVQTRTRELGIRNALGAGRLRIVRAAAASGMTAVILGIVAGLAGALALTRFLESLLFGFEPRDPVVLTLDVLVILGIAALAMFVPVRRALSVDPVRAIMSE